MFITIHNIRSTILGAITSVEAQPQAELALVVALPRVVALYSLEEVNGGDGRTRDCDSAYRHNKRWMEVLHKHHPHNPTKS